LTETLPYSWYTDDELVRCERSLIFARSWQYAGRAAQVAQPGSFLATDAGGIPIVVTRDDDGELRAFLNVCRHRGAVLTEGCGRRSTVQCHYHAWTYGLDGSLLAAPGSKLEPDFDPSQFSLFPVQVDTWGPFVFVNPDLEADPLSATLGTLPQLVAETGIDLDANQHRSVCCACCSIFTSSRWSPHRCAERARNVRLRVCSGGTTALYRTATDAEILEAAHQEAMTLVTYDRRTIPLLLRGWALRNRTHAGVIFVDGKTMRTNDVGSQVRSLAALWDAHHHEDWTNVVHYLRAGAQQ